MSGQTPRGTFNRLEFWNAVPPGHLMKTLCQIANLQHTGTGFIGNAYLLRLYESIKVVTHTNLGRGLVITGPSVSVCGIYMQTYARVM